MNTTKKTRIRRLVAASILTLAATAGTSTAHAVDTYRSGGGIGRHLDADVTCTSGTARLLTVTPVMGATPGWEFGQNVAWKYTIVNASTGAHVWVDATWRSARITTAWFTYDYYGHKTLQATPFAALPDASWNMAPGRYRVYTTYAWQTAAGWSYATARTNSYRISQNPVGIRYASLCSIGVY